MCERGEEDKVCSSVAYQFFWCTGNVHVLVCVNMQWLTIWDNWNLMIFTVQQCTNTCRQCSNLCSVALCFD